MGIDSIATHSFPLRPCGCIEKGLRVGIRDWRVCRVRAYVSMIVATESSSGPFDKRAVGSIERRWAVCKGLL